MFGCTFFGRTFFGRTFFGRTFFSFNVIYGWRHYCCRGDTRSAQGQAFPGGRTFQDGSTGLRWQRYRRQRQYCRKGACCVRNRTRRFADGVGTSAPLSVSCFRPTVFRTGQFVLWPTKFHVLLRRRTVTSDLIVIQCVAQQAQLEVRPQNVVHVGCRTNLHLPAGLRPNSLLLPVCSGSKRRTFCVGDDLRQIRESKPLGVGIQRRVHHAIERRNWDQIGVTTSRNANKLSGNMAQGGDHAQHEHGKRQPTPQWRIYGHQTKSNNWRRKQRRCRRKKQRRRFPG